MYGVASNRLRDGKSACGILIARLAPAKSVAGVLITWRRRVRECDPPRGELPFRFCALQPLPLPFGVICVLNLEWRKARLPASGESGVALGQFVDEKSERPSVGHDVVHRDDQNLAARRDTEQKNAHQRALPEVERLPSRLRRARVGFLLGASRNVQHGPKHGMNGLNELALVQIERCAKGFVAVDDVV